MKTDIVRMEADSSRDRRSGGSREAKSSAFRMARADVHVDADVSNNRLIMNSNQDMHTVF